MSGKPSKEERLETKGYLLGICSGLDRASRWLEHEAGEAYKRRDDKTAALMRNASGEIAGQATEARKRYDKEYPDDIK